jgi:hypothetical protein
VKKLAKILKDSLRDTGLLKPEDFGNSREGIKGNKDFDQDHKDFLSAELEKAIRNDSMKLNIVFIVFIVWIVFAPFLSLFVVKATNIHKSIWYGVSLAPTFLALRWFIKTLIQKRTTDIVFRYVCNSSPKHLPHFLTFMVEYLDKQSEKSGEHLTDLAELALDQVKKNT